MFRIEPGAWVLLSKLRDLGLVLPALVYFLLVAAAMPVSAYLAAIARETSFLGESGAVALSRGIIRFVSFLILFLAFVFLFRFVPRTSLPGSLIFISAISTTFLWFLAQALFGVYIANAVTLQQAYGAYLVGTAAVFWIYAASMTFIMRAEIGQLSRERSFPITEEPESLQDQSLEV